MSRRVAPELTIRAREADLYKFLLKYHPDTITETPEGKLICKDDNTITIFSGYGGGFYKYTGRETGEAGNAIDYLMRHLGYQERFVDAVVALLEFSPQSEELDANGKYIYKPKKTVIDEYEFEQKLPAKTSGKYQQVFAYLTQACKISEHVVVRLFKEKLLYQDINSNCVFKSEHCCFAEIVGTNNIVEKHFHGILGRGYWAFNAKSNNSKIYVFRSAVEAIYVYSGLRDENATYVSTGGCLKPKPYRAIKADKSLGNGEIILFFDENDVGKETFNRIQAAISDMDTEDNTQPEPSTENSAEPEDNTTQLTQEIISEFIKYYNSHNLDCCEAFNEFCDVYGYFFNFENSVKLIDSV